MKIITQTIPTNIITGFLGTGKTSAILNLLKTKPTQENWAILVNEFGEIGVDGSIFQGVQPEENGVYIKEVPGGCMCCSAGVPIKIALNQLLTRAKPQRLLIEPTGLGHPQEVIALLSDDYYKKLIRLEKVITLVDARKLADKRYTQHATFNQQISLADIIVGNKQDLYAPSDTQALLDYVQDKNPTAEQVLFTQQGQIAIELLTGLTRHDMNNKQKQSLVSPSQPNLMAHAYSADSGIVAEQALPDSGILQAINEGEGFQSIGWRIRADKVFDRRRLMAFFVSLIGARMKAVFITEDGIFAYNLSDDQLTEQALDECFESRVEIISEQISSAWESQLFSCLVV